MNELQISHFLFFTGAAYLLRLLLKRYKSLVNDIHDFLSSFTFLGTVIVNSLQCTLAWELCHKWEELECVKAFDLVVLVQLRERSAQEAAETQ